MLYCNFCLYLPLWYKRSLTRIYLLQLKIHNMWRKGIFLYQKVLHLCKNNGNCNPELIYIIFLIKLSADIRFSSFFLRFVVKSQKICQTFSGGDSFYSFNRFWNVRLSGGSQFILLTVFLLKKIHILYTRINSSRIYSYFKFLFYHIKISALN